MHLATIWLGVLMVVSSRGGLLSGQAVDAASATRPTAAARTGDSAAGAMQQVPPLQRVVALELRNVTLDQALKAIDRQAQLGLAYSPQVVPLDRRITLTAAKITAGEALERVLRGMGVRVREMAGTVFLEKRDERSSSEWKSSTLVGRVSDAKTGQGIAAAEVFLNNTAWKTMTDTAGRFRLAELNPGSYTLTVRRFGYARATRPVTLRSEREDTVDMTLEPVATKLNEIVSTATGPRRRLDVANDITTINADSVMQTAPIRSVTDLLETRVPGLTVQHTSGAPGDPSRLRLRGAGSPLRNNDPIVIVDGIRFYGEQSADRSGNLADSRYAAPSPLDYIDPNSIETIEVLKGPSAATLYGQDAANGVIVITTKKGKAGPTRWTASIERGRTSQPGEFPDLLLRWGHLLERGDPVQCLVGNLTNRLIIVGGNVPIACIADSLVHFQLLNDPVLTVLDNGHRTAVSLGASGGNGALTYAVTGSYQNELGLPQLPGYEIDRYTTLIGDGPPDWLRRPQHLGSWGVASQFGARLGAKADLALSLNVSRTSQQRSSLETQLGTLMATYADKASGTYYTSVGDQLTVNDGLLERYYQGTTDAATQFTSNLGLNWRPWQWFTMTGDAGINLINRVDEARLPTGFPDHFFDSTSAVSANALGNSLLSTINLRGNANAPLGRGFEFRFALGANYTGTSTADIVPSTAVVSGSMSNKRDDATYGWYVEPSVGNSKFNLSSGLRLDGGSSYGSGASTGLSVPTFPKLGFSYLLSDESWFPFKNQIQSLRVRVAYGRASRQPGITDRLRLYQLSHPIFVDGGLIDGAYLLSLGNTELRPERSTEFEGGFDADFWDSRINVIVTGYRKTTDDALLPKPLPPSVYGDGLAVLSNIGRIRNTGVELTVGTQWLRSGGLTWSTQFLLNQNRNIVVNLGPGVEPFYIGSNDYTGDLGLRVAPGYPLFGRWSKPILGYADANNDGVLQPNEVLVGDTAVYVGQSIPNYTAALSTTVSLWHGTLTVNAGFAYEDGLSQVNTLAQNLAVFSTGRNDSTASLAEQAATAFNLGTDYNWIQTVNTIRFNSLALTYRVPMTIARRLGAQRLDVSLQGGNLGLWTNYRGLDPNVNARATGNDVVDTGVLPVPRTWQVRVSAAY